MPQSRQQQQHQQQQQLDLHMKKWCLYGREAELAQLEEAYDRALHASRELIFIEGSSGVGKSMIMKEFCRIHQALLFGSGKFLSNTGLPCAPVITAINELILKIKRDPTLQERIAISIKQEMTEYDVSVLKKLIPTIKEFLGDADKAACTETFRLMEPEANILDRKDHSTKIKFVARALLRIISKNSSNQPVILSLWNLECADDASLNLLEFLANDQEQTSFIIALTYAVADAGVGEKAHKWMQRAFNDITQTNVITVIRLHPLNLTQLNQLLSKMTNRKEEETLNLASHLITRTNGSMYLAFQLLQQWQNDQTITYNSSTMKWEWDLIKIQNTCLSKHIGDVVSSRIQSHPLNVQRLLQLGACLGNRFDPTLLKIIEEALPTEEPLNWEETLSFCFDETLLELQSDGLVIFLHDSIRQAVLSHLSQGQDLDKLHLKIGVLLLRHLKCNVEVDDHFLFVCVDQLINGLKHMDEKSVKLEVAKLTNTVGMKAVEMSAFAVAVGYFKSGMDILNEIFVDKWASANELTQSLLIGFAEVQYYVGKFDASMEAIRELLSNNPFPGVFVRANLIRLKILQAECKLKEFVAASLGFLRDLGVNFPSEFTQLHARVLRHRAMKKLNGMSDEAILSLPRATDSKAIVTQHVLKLMTIPVETLGLVHMTSIIVHKAVLLSIGQGLTPLTPQALALLGTYLISERGMLAEGYRLGQLALKLSETLNASTLDCDAVFWAYSMTIPWQGTPLNDCIPALLEGYGAGLKQGNPFIAFMMINAYLSMSFYSGKSLGLLEKDINKFSTQMLEYGQKTIFLQILPIWQCVLNLLGRSPDPLNMFSGKALDKQILVGNEGQVGLQACWSYLMQIAVYMSNWELASEMSTKLQSLNIGFMKAHTLYPVRVFFFGIIAIENARRTGKRKYKQEAVKHMQCLRRWVDDKAINMAHKLLILQAGWHSLSAKSGGLLKVHYDAAIKASNDVGFVQDAALAAQLAGGVLSQFEDTVCLEESYFVRSHEMWVNWGAFALATHLGEKMRNDFPGVALDLIRFHSNEFFGSDSEENDRTGSEGSDVDSDDSSPYMGRFSPH